MEKTVGKRIYIYYKEYIYSINSTIKFKYYFKIKYVNYTYLL